MKTTSELPEKIAFVDVETTGMRPTYDRIIEIGIIRVENGKVVSKLNSLINPHVRVSPFIESLTGISSEELSNATDFEDIKDNVYELLDGALFVAHNVRFDYGFIRSELKRNGLPFSAKQMCTVKLSRLLYPTYKKHNLTALIERFGLECKHRHRAFDDARVLWQFYKKITADFDTSVLTKTFHHVQSKPTFPKELDPNTVEDLPENPGVYKFYDSFNTLLYIGKSKNIKARVLQHFNSDFSSSKQLSMCQKIARIEYIETAGELGALLRESELVKKLQPIFNRQLRYKKVLTIVQKSTNDDGYIETNICDVSCINPHTVDTIVGVFRSKKQAKDFLSDLAKENQLCPKLLGVENASEACFLHRLHICKGACIGQESSRLYNARFAMATASNQLKPWHFDNPIMIIEKNPYTHRAETFVIDKWCVLENKLIEGDTSFEPEHNLGSDYEFDVDTYKILSRYLRRNSSTVQRYSY